MALRAVAITVLALALGAAPAHAKVAHTVAPGETLWSIAAASNLTTRTLAAFNGLPDGGNVVLGSTIWIPSEAEGAAALAGAGGASSGSGSGAAPQGAAAPPPLGAYVVQPGDTLSGIASRSGVSVGQVAFMNGLDPSGFLVTGARLKLPTGAPGSAGGPGGASSSAAAPSPPQPSAVPAAPPHPTSGRASSSQIGQIASKHGVPASLASAIAWQESGFNNGMVSSANARGVMQVMPGTWRWVEQNLAGRALDPRSTNDNVHAGVMYLGQLLRDTGGDPTSAAAAYYQGLGSVRSRGMLPETQRYVANVMALRSSFGSP
jgi:LysM repeat protein